MVDPYAAAFAGDTSTVDGWLKTAPAHAVNATSSSRGQTLLYIAARRGHFPLVKLLVESWNADVNARNARGDGARSTPLHGAAFGGHDDVLGYLLAHGAAPKKNEYGETPLDNAKEPSEGVSKEKAARCLAILQAPPGAPPSAPTPQEAEKPPAATASAADAAPKEAPKTLTGPTAADAKPKEAPAATAKAEPPPVAGMSIGSAAQLLAKGITELRALCAAVGLSTAGAKSAIVQRLAAYGARPNTTAATGEAGGGEDSPPKKKQKAESPAANTDSKEEHSVAPAAAPPGPPAKVTSAPVPQSQSPPTGPCPGEGVSLSWVEALRKAEFEMIEVCRDTEDFWDLETKVQACCQGRNDDYVKNRIKKKKKPLLFILKRAWKVVNRTLDDAFEAKRKELIATRGEAAGRVRTAFHGTKPANIDSILRSSLLRFGHPLNPCKEQADDGYFGTNRKGVYVSRYFDYCLKYCNGLNPLDEGESARLIMFRCLPGSTFHVKELNMGMDPTPGHDSHSSPSHLEWYLFDERQLAPDYVLELQAKEDTRTAADDE